MWISANLWPHALALCSDSNFDSVFAGVLMEQQKTNQINQFLHFTQHHVNV